MADEKLTEATATAEVPVETPTETTTVDESIDGGAEEDFNEMFDLAEADEAEFGADEPAPTTQGDETSGEAVPAEAGEVEEGAAATPTPDPAAEAGQPPETPEPGEQGQEPSPEPDPQEQPVDPWSQLTPEQQAEQLADFQGKAVDLLADQIYGLSEDEVTAFQEDPGTMLPQFAGRLHMQIMQAATMNVLRLMPQVLENYNTQQQQGTSFREKFYTDNSDLNHEEHGARVLQFGQMYRQMNPQATNEQLINDVGAWVRTSLGLPPLGQTAAAPVAQPVVQPTPPYQPAGAGAQGNPAQGVSGNEFEEIFAGEFDE